MAGVTAPLPYRFGTVYTSPNATVDAISTGIETDDRLFPLPDDVTVAFRDAHDIGHAADVATWRALPAGTTVTVLYAVNDPGQATIDRDDGGPRIVVALAPTVQRSCSSWCRHSADCSGPPGHRAAWPPPSGSPPDRCSAS
jgi:hypothetical protein